MFSFLCLLFKDEKDEDSVIDVKNAADSDDELEVDDDPWNVMAPPSTGKPWKGRPIIVSPENQQPYATFIIIDGLKCEDYENIHSFGQHNTLYL